MQHDLCSHGGKWPSTRTYVHRYVMTTRVKDVADKDMLDADAEPMLLARVIKNWTTLYRYIAMKGQWVTTAERRVLYSVDRQTE
jgi:hypothetical protein